MDIEVKGMTCDGCVRSVDRLIRRLDGVKDVAVVLEGGRVHIEGAPDPKALTDALAKAGYTAVL